MDRLTPSSLEGPWTLILWLRMACAFQETFVYPLASELKETAEESRSN